jgi:hypothetical protein
LEIARTLAREQRARLDLVHVVPMAADAASREKAEQALARLVEQHSDIAMRWTLLAGDVAENILWMAREFRPDLLVLAGRKRTWLESLVSASVSRDVARRSPCPVLRLDLPAEWPSQQEPAVTEPSARAAVATLAHRRVRQPQTARAPRCPSCERLFGKKSHQRPLRERISS